MSEERALRDERATRQYPIKVLKFPATAPVDIPAKGCVSAVGPSDRRHDMLLDLGMGLVRITYTPPEGDKHGPDVLFVPISRVESIRFHEPEKPAAPKPVR